jgi:RND family efflux transporter MFP subunit
MSKKTKKKFMFLIVSMVALVIGVTVWWQWRAQAQPGPQYKTVAVTRGDLVQKVAATGKVEPEYIVEIKPKASGEVEEVRVQEGDAVKKGQLLIKIDPAVEDRQVKKARAELRMNQASYVAIRHKRDYAKQRLARERKLFEKGLVSKETVDDLRKEKAVLDAELSVKGAQIVRAKEALSEARDRLSETHIYAPVAGTVLERLVQPGQIAASGTKSVSGGTALLRIADLSRLFIRMEVDEVDVAKIKAGMPARITADAFTGKRFSGHVVRISPQGKEENNVTVFEVLVEAGPAGSRALRPNMTANVEIIIAERKDAVLLPMRVLSGRSRGGRKSAARVVLADGRKQRIRLGISDGIHVEVLSGLKPGEAVRLQTKSRKKSRSSRRGKRKRRSKMRTMRRAMRGRRQ